MAKKRKPVSEREAKRRKEQAKSGAEGNAPRPGAPATGRGGATFAPPAARRTKTGRGQS